MGVGTPDCTGLSRTLPVEHRDPFSNCTSFLPGRHAPVLRVHSPALRPPLDGVNALHTFPHSVT